MNREIKFRAWDKLEKWMVNDFYLSSDGNCFDYPFRVYNTPHVEIEEVNNYIVMQYTGLKDNNGKEIYEGDIGDWHGRKFKVMFEYGCFVMRSIDEEGYVNGFHENCEIIGNVFEHSHLLEESK